MENNDTGALMDLSKEKQFVLITGIHPESRQPCTFKISTERIRKMSSSHPAHVIGNLRNVETAVSEPLAIWKGLKRDGEESSYCYCARPPRRYVNEDESVKTEDAFVFLVFINSALEVLKWRFEKADETDKNRPDDFSRRFDTLLWSK